MTSPVLVVGGTGHYGRHVTRSLVERGAPARVLSRDADAARHTLGPGPEIAVGDVESVESVSRALDGVRSVVICISAGNRKLLRRREQIEGDGVRRVLDLAAKAGVSRVVYFSGYEMRVELLRRLGILRFAEIQLGIEDTLRSSSSNWTILGCAPSTDLFFATLRGQRLIAPGGGPPLLPTVSPWDVGRIAAQAALRDDLGGRRFRVTGPQAMSFPAAAERLSQVLGRPIAVRRVPLAAFAAAAFVTRPFEPFVHYMYCAIKLMNNFPQDLAAAVPEDHRVLRDTFDYAPRSFDDDIRERFPTR